MKLSATLALGFNQLPLPYLFHGDPDTACASIRRAGFNAVEILISEPALFSPSALNKMLEGHHLKLSAVGTGGAYITRRLSLCSPDPSVREAAESYIREIIALAAPLGAIVILGLVVGTLEPGVSKEAALQFLSPALNRLGDTARSEKTLIVIEPVNRYESNILNRLEQGLELIADLSTDGVKLLADFFHMNIEESCLPSAIRKAGRHLGHVHLVDTNRQAPGAGHLDYSPIFAALTDIGYEDFLSVEAFPLPTSESASRQAIATYQQFIGSTSPS